MTPSQKIPMKQGKGTYSSLNKWGILGRKPLDHVFVHMFSAYVENSSPL